MFWTLRKKAFEQTERNEEKAGKQMSKSVSTTPHFFCFPGIRTLGKTLSQNLEIFLSLKKRAVDCQHFLLF